MSQEGVFDLTGRTGSYFYMAPEVLHNEAYNEKVHNVMHTPSARLIQEHLTNVNQAGRWLWQEPAVTHGTMSVSFAGSSPDRHAGLAFVQMQDPS